ncbi:unnamed protein product, partial [Brassica rapa subsp. trilocularis]
RLGGLVLTQLLQDIIQFGPLEKDILGIVVLTKPQIIPLIFRQL